MLPVHIHVLVSALILICHGFSLAIHPQVQRTYDIDKVNRDIAKHGEVKQITNVKCCPKMCHCVTIHTYNWIIRTNYSTLVVEDCSQDPTEELARLLFHRCIFDGYRVVRAKLPDLPCKVLSEIPAVQYLDLSENSIQRFFCRESILVYLDVLNISHNNLEAETMHVYMSHTLDIDLSYNKLGAVPCGIGLKHRDPRPRLQHLDLSYNLIRTAPCNISHTPLRILNMTHNQLQTFPCNLSVLPNLLYMNLSYNHIEDMSCNTFNLPALLTLDLSYNSMSVVPCMIGDLWKIQTLDLSYNLIETVPCNISRIPLQRLNMTHNQIQTFPCNLSVLPSLLYMNLSYNHIEDMSCNTINLPDLQVLDLSYNDLKAVHFNLSTLPNLTTLHLNHNDLKVVTCYLLASPTLEVIQIHHNQLEAIRCNLSKMESLNSMDLSHNKLKVMPCDLPPQLKSLDCSYNQIQNVPCDFQYAAQNVVLNLTYNDILTFPCNLTTLHKGNLDLSHNRMHGVACKSSHAFRLLKLYMSYNDFETLPCEVSRAGIKTLDMSHNSIQTIACDLSDMEQLRLLNLDNNNLGTIPCNLTSLPKRFKWGNLGLNHNHIKTLPSCLKDLPLASLNLAYNEISTLQDDAFSGHVGKQLSHIVLNNNNLSTIEFGTFKSCQVLMEVHLENNNLHLMESWPRNSYVPLVVFASNNKITKFSNSARAQLTSCQGMQRDMDIFAMDGNDIRHIMDVFNGWNIKVNFTDEIHECMAIFDFSNNPLTCDCVDYNIYVAIHDNKTRYRSQNLTCHEPQTLRGLNPASVPLDSFVCNVSEKCSEGCLCYNTPHSGNFSVTCSQYEGTKLPGELPDLPNDNYMYYLNMRGMHLDNIENRPYFTKVAEAVFSYNVISQITIDALLSLRNVSKLYLEANHLKRLPDDIASVILGPDVQLRLGDNPWVCDCKAVAMKEWLIRNNQNIQDKNNVKCFFPAHTKGRQMIHVASSIMCSQEVSNTTPILVAILGGVFCLSLICLTLGCTIQSNYRLRGHERKDWEPINWDEEVDEGKEFDVFVSYSNEDEEYVGEYLIPELENRGFKVCFHRVHFLAGKSIIDNICECIAKSKKVLVFYSMNYKDSDFGMYEYTLAMQLDVQNGSNRLVTIVDTDLDIENLQIAHSTYLRTHSYVIKDERNLWRNLNYVLPKHKLGVDAQGRDDDEM